MTAQTILGFLTSRVRRAIGSRLAALPLCLAFAIALPPSAARPTEPDPIQFLAAVTAKLCPADAGDAEQIEALLTGARLMESSDTELPGRGILHYWRMVKSDSLVIWTGGPVGFELEVGINGRRADGRTRIFSESAGGEVAVAPLSGVRAPCPRQVPPA